MKFAMKLSLLVLSAFAVGSVSRSIAYGAALAEPASVDELLDRVEKTLQGLKAYSCKFDVALDLRAPGMERSAKSSFDVKIEKPHRWAIVKQDGPFGGTSISDGKEETTFLPMLEAYVVKPLSAEGEQPPSPELPLMLLGPAGQPKAFMGEGLKQLLIEGVSESKLAGEEAIDGQPCWRCEFKQDGLSWELWVTKEENPKPRRVVAKPDYSSTPGAPEGASMTVQVDMTDFNDVPKLTDKDFTFSPPEGARKVKSFMEAMGGAGPQAPHELVGKEAPNFEIEILDGEKFKLKDVLGKKVVMLDFWATWCGPCVAALPQISAAAQEMKDRDVVFYAVNLNEDADAVKEFLSEKELDVPVLLDADGAVGELYKAAAIPQTVLIGKDGRVQVVHVGFGGEAKSMLVEELTALLEGKDLAKETLDRWEAEQKSASPDEGEAEEADSGAAQ